MDLQNEAIEIQKILHQNYKTYWEETEAIKAHLEARFKALGLYDVVGRSEQLTAEKVLELLNDCDHLDDAKMWFNEYGR